MRPGMRFHTGSGRIKATGSTELHTGGGGPTTAYFGILEIFDPSRVRLYIRPSWPTTNPTIG